MGAASSFSLQTVCTWERKSLSSHTSVSSFHFLQSILCLSLELLHVLFPPLGTLFPHFLYLVSSCFYSPGLSLDTSIFLQATSPALLHQVLVTSLIVGSHTLYSPTSEHLTYHLAIVFSTPLFPARPQDRSATGRSFMYLFACSFIHPVTWSVVTLSVIYSPNTDWVLGREQTPTGYRSLLIRTELRACGPLTHLATHFPSLGALALSAPCGTSEPSLKPWVGQFFAWCIPSSILSILLGSYMLLRDKLVQWWGRGCVL